MVYLVKLPNLSLQYSSSLLIHISGGLPLTPFLSVLLSYNPLHKVILIHSYHMSKASQSTLLHTIHFPCCYTHTKTLRLILVTFSIPSLHTTCSSCECSAIFHGHVPDAHDSWENNAIFYTHFLFRTPIPVCPSLPPPCSHTIPIHNRMNKELFLSENTSAKFY